MMSAFGVEHTISKLADPARAQKATRLAMNFSLKGKQKEAARAKKIWEKNVSKGLPRYLKDIAPGIGASPSRTFQGGRPLSRNDHVYLRVRAHQAGKEASRANAEWKKMPKTMEGGNIGRAEEKWQETHRAATKGRMGREGARKAIKDNTYTRPKKRLP